MEEPTESVIKVERADNWEDNNQVIVIKSERSELPSSHQKTDTSLVKMEDNQVHLKSEPTLQIDDVEDISSEDEDKLEDISDDEDDNNFEEAPISNTDNPSTSLNEESTDNQNINGNIIIPTLSNGYYNPVTRNDEDLQYLIQILKENPKMNACSYCWRMGHFAAKCNDKLWYKEINKNCPVWMEGCLKRKQVYFEMRPDTLEKIKTRRKAKQKEKKMNYKFGTSQSKCQKVEIPLPPGDEFEVVEELSSSEEEDKQTEKLTVTPSSVTSPIKARENLILKNEVDLNFLKRCLTEPEASKRTCNYCSRAGHIKINCEDRKISDGLKLCPIWREGLVQRKRAYLELREGAKEIKAEKNRRRKKRLKEESKVKSQQKAIEEGERREMEENLKREELEDHEKRRKIEAAEMLLEIVNELLE